MCTDMCFGLFAIDKSDVSILSLNAQEITVIDSY